MGRLFNVCVSTAIAAFLLVTALIVFFPTTNKGFAMSMNMVPSSIAHLLPSSSSTSNVRSEGLNFHMDSGAFTPVAMQTAQTMMKEGVAHIHKITLVAYDTNLTLPQGNVIHAMTFNGTVPAPTIRVTQGDMINVTLINYPKNKNGHSVDNHASINGAVPNNGPVMPGQERSYAFIATQPGFFKYHDEGIVVVSADKHVFSGMAGGVIVDPVNGYTGYKYTTYNDSGTRINETISPNAKEVAYVFSEWYLDKNGNYNQSAMFNHDPTYYTINGIPYGYDPVVTKTKDAMPLHFKQGDHVRFFLLNAGDAMVSFHIVGGQLDRVISNQMVQGLGTQTYLLGPSSDAIIDVVFNKPSVYAPANHDYAALFKGQASIVVVDGPDGQPGKTLGLEDPNNPSNAIPPMGKNSIPVQTKPYQLGTPLVLTSDQIGALSVCKAETCP
jgi:nitrite reductase (NO-forming)